MQQNKLITFIHRLYSKSIKGELDWEQNDIEDVFQLAFANYTVNISTRQAYNSPDIDIIIAIYNEDGNIVERVLDTDLTNSINHPYKVFNEIYNNARRKAMGVDSALDEILDILEEDENAIPLLPLENSEKIVRK